jgi:hypothetical protein
MRRARNSAGERGLWQKHRSRVRARARARASSSSSSILLLIAHTPCVFIWAVRCQCWHEVGVLTGVDGLVAAAAAVSVPGRGPGAAATAAAGYGFYNCDI